MVKEGSSGRLMSQGPPIGLAPSTVKEFIADWMRKFEVKQWKKEAGCRQAKSSLMGTNCPSANRAIGLPRAMLKALVVFVA